MPWVGAQWLRLTAGLTIRNLESPYMRLETDFAYFKELLLKHCIHRPPYSEKVFNYHEGQIIVDYAMQT